MHQVIEHLIDYLSHFIGVRYHFGGKNPLIGLDCSGLICEGLMAVGALPFGSVLNAQQLYNKFSIPLAIQVPAARGNLVFFGSDLQHIDHVGLCLGDGLMLEAGGGHTDDLTPEMAAQHGAFTKIRPIKYRRDFLCVVSMQAVLIEPVIP